MGEGINTVMLGCFVCTDKVFFSPGYIHIMIYEERNHSPSGADPVSILRKSISGRHRPVRVADGPMTARCRFT